MTFLSNIETLTKLELTQFIELKKGVKMPNITQTMFNSICSITSLIDLTLTDLPMANIKYVRLTKLTGLKKLELEYCDPDQVAFFTVLAQLPRLTVLRINPWQHNKSITKKLINHIATIPTLKYLNEDTDITPKKDYGSPNIRNISDDESNDNKSEDESNDNKSEDESND
jgi:hypothetical protein